MKINFTILKNSTIIFFSLLLFFNSLIVKINSRLTPFRGDKYAETCVACKFIWENINEALEDEYDDLLEGSESGSKRKNPILISQSFQYFCQISPDIFYESCNIMFEKLFFMTEDFINKDPVEIICKKNDLC